jgi:DNA repair protein RadA/Sms
VSKTASRPQTRFVCQSCGESFLRWEGQCRACSAWNSLVETQVRSEPRAARAQARHDGWTTAASPTRLDEVVEPARVRLPVGIAELDRVLGGGLVAGSVVLLGGEPGIGKSTLLLQAAAGVAALAGPERVLYATGEESASQVRLRADRLGLLGGPGGGIRIVAESSIDRIVDVAGEGGAAAAPGSGSAPARPALLVVDSIQTATIDDLEGPAGSVGQVRGSALRLMELAKPLGIACVLVGHVTKDGSIAGPKTLEHLVDAVLTLEGERSAGIRLLRATKNRFGSTEEVGVFEMGESGMAEVADPARAFLADHDGPAPGSVVAPTLEGSRPLLVEVQALVAANPGMNPRRTTSGVDANRVALLIAVLGRRAGIGLSGHDVYVNLAGGLSVDEPGLDLPLALALASTLRDRPIVPGTVAIGEVGLLGELRAVAGLERRLREAARLGFSRAIVPRPPRGAVLGPVPDLEVVAVGTLREAVEAALAGPSEPGRRMATAPARC